MPYDTFDTFDQLTVLRVTGPSGSAINNDVSNALGNISPRLNRPELADALSNGNALPAQDAIHVQLAQTPNALPPQGKSEGKH